MVKTYFYHSPKLYHPQPLANERTLSNDSSAESTYLNPPYPIISTLIQLYPLSSSSYFLSLSTIYQDLLSIYSFENKPSVT